MKTINNWEPETRDLLQNLVKAGCEIVSGDNGEDKFKYTGDLAAFICELTACDEAHVFLKTPNSKNIRWIYLVFGNSPGELPSDYIVDPTFDEVTTAHYDKWVERKQPTLVID